MSLGEVRDVLNATGGAGSSDLHRSPLVAIEQGPQGTTITTVATAGGPSDTATGALQITDPFAVSDTESYAEVHSKTLRDAIDGHGKQGRDSMGMADIEVDEHGLVTVGSNDVVAPDGATKSGHDAALMLAQLSDEAAGEGIDREACVERAERASADLLYGDNEDNLPEIFAQQAELCPPLVRGSAFSLTPAEAQLFEASMERWNALNPDIPTGAPRISDTDAFAAYRAYLQATENDPVPTSFGRWVRASGAGTNDIERLRGWFVDRVKHYVGSSSKSQGNADYEKRFSEWTAARGHDHSDLSAQVGAEQQRKYKWRAKPGVRQEQALATATKMLASLGEPRWDQRISAAAFSDELGHVSSAAGTDKNRPVLHEVHFGKVLGRHRMTATDSYRLHSSIRALPDGLKAEACSLPASDLAAWQRAARGHLKDAGGTSIGVAHATDDAEVKGTVALCAGQVRMASRSSAQGAYPTYDDVLQSAGSQRAVTVNPSDLPKLKSSSREGGPPVHLSLVASDGQVTGLGWAMRDDNRWAEGIVEASPSSRRHTQPEIPFASARRGFVGDAFRFAAAGDQNVEIRNWGVTNQMAIVPAGAPDNAEDVDRIALVMPYRAAV